MKDDLTKIHALAVETRQWAERFREQHKNHFQRNLQGMCAVTSAYLFKRLTDEGLYPKIGYARARFVGHVFVICNGLVVDVTASQYGKKKIIVSSLKGFKPPASWPTKDYDVLDSLAELELEQSIWSPAQQFTTYKHEWDYNG
tara:strand:- start:357 stop:785 length:429 start_codon:yes stop_codon:yes gene_type:complete